jgi:predicted CoA-binding protein
MKATYQNPELIKKILDESHTIAVVGLSDKNDRPSFGVALYLQNQGYKIIPINPNISMVLDEKAFPDLSSVAEKIDVVDIFRRSEEVGPVVDQAIEKKARFIWMQEGIINEPAAKRAIAAGLEVVMDCCMLKEHKRIHK